MKNKQEVIEAIQGWMLDDGGSEYDLYNRIAPFMKEGLWVLATAPSDTAHVHFPPVVDTTPKGTCQKCGGSKKVPGETLIDWARDPINRPTKEIPCPECASPEGARECQHKGDIGWINPIGDCGDVKKVGPPICFDCKQGIERRSGKERRVKRSPRMTVHDLSGSWFMSKETTSLKLILYPDLRDGKDRRGSYSSDPHTIIESPHGDLKLFDPPDLKGPRL